MKKIMTVLLIVLLMMTTATAFAQTPITVSGTGEVRLSADTAVISLGVTARDRDVLKAQQKVNESIAAIRKALTEKGIREENINTEFMNIYAMTDYTDSMEQLSAYHASSTLAVRVTDLDSAGTVIDAAFAAGANTLNGISFFASDTSQAEEEAMRKAVADAKAKADILADAAGMQVIGIQSISEGGVYSVANQIGNVRAKGMDWAEEAEADTGTVVQAAKLIVSASVTMVFDAE